MKIFLKLLLFVLLLARLQVSASPDDSIAIDTAYIESTTDWPEIYNHKGEWSAKAFLFSRENDTFKNYMCFPYTYWALKKPFVAVDAFDPFTPPEYAIIKLPGNNDLLIFIVLINVMFIIAIIKISNERNLLSFVSSLYSNISAVKYYGERTTLFNRVNMQLLFVQLLLIALGLTLYKDIPVILPDSSLLRFVTLFSFFLGAVLFKIFITWSLEQIFEIEKFSVVITNHVIGVNFIATLIILPVFLVIYLNNGHSNSLFLPIIATTTVMLSLFVRMIRSYVLLNLSFPYPKIYLLLYFCTAEILPWLIIFKLIAY